MSNKLNLAQLIVTTVSATALALNLSATTARAAGGPTIIPATLSIDYRYPLDATPDPDAKMIYFVARDKAGKARGVFKVRAEGSPVETVFVGAPFVAPTGIAMSTDGQHIVVADAGVGANQLFRLGIAEGSRPIAIPGTAGTAPRNLDVVLENGQVTIYFSGIDPQDKQAGIFKISIFGANKPVTVYKGAPLVQPDGVAVGPNNTVYVADRAAAGARLGKVFKIVGGKATELVARVRTGNPAGIALTKDGGTLLVSAFQPNSKFDQVLVVNTTTGATASVTDVVGKNTAAGGVHRAHNVNVFAWADSEAPPPPCCKPPIRAGVVYRVEP
jgi:DNA-binding beta-propeller fold protein YncE